MKPDEHDPYRKGGTVLLLASMLFLILAFLRAGWAIAPLLILSAMGLFLTGLLLLTFSRRETPDPVVASLLPVQHQINTALLLSRSGSRDPAVFLPSPDTDGKVIQFHALPPGATGLPGAGSGLAHHGKIPGILLPPACLPLLRELEARFHLRIPAGPEQIPQLLREVGEEALEIAVRVPVTVGPEGIRVDLNRFALYPGCRVIRETSADICVRNPCTICSLLACLVVRASGKECHIASVGLDDRSDTVHLEFSFRPPVRESIAMVPEGPVFPVPAISAVPATEEPVPLSRGKPEDPVTAEPAVPFPEESGSPFPGEPEPVAAGEPVSPFPEEAAIPVPSVAITPVTEKPASQVSVPEPEVAAWWKGHPGSRRLRYLEADDVVSPLPVPVAAPVDAVSVSPVPADAAPPVAPEMVPPLPAGGVIPAAGERGSLPMEELVARAMRDLGSREREEPMTPVVEEPIPPSREEPAVPSEVDVKPPAPGKPESGERKSRVKEKRVPGIRVEEKEVPAMEAPERFPAGEQAGPREKKPAPPGTRKKKPASSGTRKKQPPKGRKK